MWDKKQNKTKQKLYFEKTIPLSVESFAWYISIPVWIIILSKLEIEGDSCQEILSYPFKLGDQSSFQWMHNTSEQCFLYIV